MLNLNILDLIFSNFNVRSQNINSIVFRLARHLCSSTSLVYMYVFMDGMYVWMVRMPFKRARGLLLSPKNTAF